jgi:hypothetical protein
MSDPTTLSESPPQGVRTPGALLCPGPDGQKPLKPGQKVCSPRCRAASWRRAREARDREVRELLEAALRTLNEGRNR